MKLLRYLTYIIFAVMVLQNIGCSSEDVDGSTTPATPITADGTGVWEGTFTENGLGTFDLIGLVEGDQLRLISLDAGVTYVGTIAVSESSFTSTVTGYEMEDGIVIATIDLTGTIVTKSTISGTFTSSSGASGSFSLTYDPVTDRGSSLADIAGTWAELRVSQKIIIIDSSGNITDDSDILVCTYTGLVSIIDPAVNIYGMSLNVDSCDQYNGLYTGYAVITDAVAANGTLTFVVNNTNYLIVNVFTRQ